MAEISSISGKRIASLNPLPLDGGGLGWGWKVSIGHCLPASGGERLKGARQSQATRHCEAKPKQSPGFKNVFKFKICILQISFSNGAKRLKQSPTTRHCEPEGRGSLRPTRHCACPPLAGGALAEAIS